ncbi:phosphatase PAP2 family protein [Haloarchaeobius amylolyticus]|uniref:phosphatase PAP2 family protein n=1 Tax=Haloarchaeobius amylolyticus TaxID=1198296 RepID=UPI0022700557|nr:phosphatase PAP2 family protein [Haloarchaeobius amylolyticus]
MGVVAVASSVLVIDLLLFTVAGVVLFDRPALARARGHIGSRLREVVPYVVVLGGVLLVNRVAREAGPDLSYVIGWNLTDELYAIEGTLVATIQTVQHPLLTRYFSFIYLPGYVFLLTFPPVLYVVARDPRPLKETILTFTLNYSLGLVCYILFISYGPRNLLPEAVEPLLYSTYPDTQVLTGEVNSNSNVFPSLHASLSVSAATLAVRHHDAYPKWTPIAVWGAASVCLATMYLGIHWATDVAAGIVLGVGSVWLAGRVVDWEERR